MKAGAVGRLGNKEELTTGELGLRIFLSGNATTLFTLDPAEASRLWYTLRPEREVGATEFMDDLVRQLMKRGMDAVQDRVPSLLSDQITVRSEKNNSREPYLNASGHVQFLRSEWDAIPVETKSELPPEHDDSV